jgi:hypothetical protein
MAERDHIGRVRHALAMRDAGYDTQLEPVDVAELLRLHDQKAALPAHGGGTGDLIAARIRKYTRDLESHPAPSQPDGVCRCDKCRDARTILNELLYMEMAERHLRARSPAQPRGREEIARIIDPVAFVRLKGCIERGYLPAQREEWQRRVDDAYQIADAILSLPASAGEGWQDISTAPKDGPYLICGTWQGRPHVREAEGFERPRTLWRNIAPTHWRPLPSPPSEGKP